MVPMNRRRFLKATGLAGIAAAFPAFTLGPGCARQLCLPEMHFGWQGWMTTRPFAPDYDDAGKIWFGSSKFFCYDPVARTTEQLDNTPLGGKSYSTCLCQGDKVYVLTQKSPELVVYHRQKKEYSRHTLPDPESNIWFGVRVPGDARLYLYVRNRNKVVVWDTESDRGREIAYPDAMDLWSGFYVEADNAIYSFTLEAKPCRLVRFDLKTQSFDAVIPALEPGLEITGVNPIGDWLYCADRFTGRVIPFNFVKRTWGEPVAVPGHMSVFSFIGMGTTFRGLALYCLSTYKGTMKWDYNRNAYLSTGDENIGIDGKPHHFMNKYLVFDPSSREFGYLEAPETEGKRYPLICYSLVCRDQLIISGYDLGDLHNRPAAMGEREGELCLFQSVD